VRHDVALEASTVVAYAVCIERDAGVCRVHDAAGACLKGHGLHSKTDISFDRGVGFLPYLAGTTSIH
jgi:hypothetical protein